VGLITCFHSTSRCPSKRVFKRKRGGGGGAAKLREELTGKGKNGGEKALGNVWKTGKLPLRIKRSKGMCERGGGQYGPLFPGFQFLEWEKKAHVTAFLSDEVSKVSL